ncbi:MAG TPA: phenylalanine--tRNA ligase subunit beta, partial [Spirochaetaceae bacterium]|nr:phenylalanine--tRNA ligase subunit beta [Spirochaetaceae bacterium]
MPKIDVNKNVFEKLYGRNIRRDRLEDVFPCAKAEFDGEDNDFIKVELNDTNRPDLWSTPGLARQLSSFVEGKRYDYDFFSTPKKSRDSGSRKFIVDASRPDGRPYSVGFCVSGKKITEDILKLLIDFQEKMHSNYGRKRKSISMGLYRSDAIDFPVIYKGADPKSNSYVPLHEDHAMTLEQVLTDTEKGREFGHLIAGWEKFPYLVDSSGKTLSMPPIINSNDVGALKVGDSDIFIEINGQYLKQVLLVANIFACDFADLGFKILPCKTVFPEETEFGREITVPFYFQEKRTCSKSELEELLGSDISLERAVKCLNRMGVRAKADANKIVAFPPEYRNDFLAASDVAEDVAIGYGYNNFKKEMLSDFTIGRLSSAEEFNRKVQKILIGLGFSEMIFNYLSSKKEYIENMLVSGDEAVQIQNAMNLNYKVVRPSIIPSLLKSESQSGQAAYPHRIFETGKVCVKDENEVTGTRTDDNVGFIECSSGANLNNCVSVLNSFMYYLDLEYELKECDDPRFIKGRCAKVIVFGEQAGIL